MFIYFHLSDFYLFIVSHVVAAVNISFSSQMY